MTTNSTSLHSLIFLGGVILNASHFVVASQAKSRLFFFFFTAVKIFFKKKPCRDSDLWEAASETLRKIVWLCLLFALLVVCALSLSLRHQKRDSHSPFEEDDVRENIISYDDEGGGEADTAAFDITALQSMHRIQHMRNNGNM